MSLREYYQFISAKGKCAMWEKKAHGELMHLAPLGFKNVHVNGKSTMVTDPKTWPLVQIALKLRKEGNTIKEICHTMEKLGLRSQRGNIIGISEMHRILGREYLEP